MNTPTAIIPWIILLLFVATNTTIVSSRIYHLFQCNGTRLLPCRFHEYGQRRLYAPKPLETAKCGDSWLGCERSDFTGPVTRRAEVVHPPKVKRATFVADLTRIAGTAMPLAVKQLSGCPVSLLWWPLLPLLLSLSM